MATSRFRMRPRWPWLPGVIIGFGAALIVFAWVARVPPRTRTVETAAGAVLIVLALMYLRSPLWRSYVVVDDDGLRVETPRGLRLELPWKDVVRVRAAAATETCYIDAGMPARSFLLPGPGIAAPFRVERRGELYRLIVAACAGRVEEVAELEPPRPRRGAGAEVEAETGSGTGTGTGAGTGTGTGTGS